MSSRPYPQFSEPFEQFKDIFEDWIDGIKQTWEVKDAINSRFQNQGYRMLATLDTPSHPYSDEQALINDEVYRSIMQALDEGGTVVWYQINNAGEADGNATFGSLRLEHRPNGFVDESVHIAKYFDGEYDFNEHILSDDAYAWRFDDLGVGKGHSVDNSEPDMQYIGLHMKQHEALNEEGEVEWVRKIQLPTSESEKTYTWLTNAVYIPQPYNIRFTPYINETIRKSIRKAKL